MTIQLGGTTVVNSDRSITLGTSASGGTTGSLRWSGSAFEVNNGSSFGAIISTPPALQPALWGAGSQSNGALGNNYASNFSFRSSPVSVVGGFTDWVQVSAGYNASAGIKANGTAWMWGSNYSNYGQLGNNVGGASAKRSSPTSVVGGFTDWNQISTFRNHTVAVRANGSVWTWGRNNSGQLGRNNTTNYSSPVSVLGGFTDWVQVGTGYQRSFAIRANGTLWSWGSGAIGMLGNGSNTDRSSPVSVLGGFTDWISVHGNFGHATGLRANGTLWSWGQGGSGRLGNGTANSYSPLSVAGGFTDWITMSAGYNHGIGVRANGQAWSWGGDNQGQLGEGGLYMSRTSPTSVAGGFTDWVQVSAGKNFTFGVRANGTAWSWGYNNIGQRMVNATGNAVSPVSVAGGWSDWIFFATGYVHSLGIRNT